MIVGYFFLLDQVESWAPRGARDPPRTVFVFVEKYT